MPASCGKHCGFRRGVQSTPLMEDLAGRGSTPERSGSQDGATRTGLPTNPVRSPAASGCGAYRYRIGGRDSKRVQRGGFASERDARDALERELERLRRERQIPRSLTLAELVGTYLAQHDVQPVTIEKLRYLLSKATAVFGDRKIGELTSQEIAQWRMNLSPGDRFEATQTLRQVLHRAVAWGMNRNQSGQGWRRQPGTEAQGAASVRVVGGTG